MHAVLLAILPVLVATNFVSVPNLERFPRMTMGRYEVLAQRDKNTAWQVVWFMNRIAEHYGKEFTNAMPAAKARVIVFSNHDHFVVYAKQQRGEAQSGLAGYTAVRKDPGGGRQWELVAFEFPGMWRTLAHESLPLRQGQQRLHGVESRAQRLVPHAGEIRCFGVRRVTGLLPPDTMWNVQVAVA